MKFKNLCLIVSLLMILPVPILAQGDTIFRSFTVRQVDNGVLIGFTIKGGITCSGVKIERSDDRSVFKEIYEFAGVCGGINTDESYSYTDINPVVNKESWYRLDLGSLGLYSDVISIKYISYDLSGITLFPNPCRDECSIYISNNSQQPHDFLLFDRLGKQVLQKEISGESLTFKSINFKPSIYYYRIYRNDELRFSGKILIL